MIYAYDFTSKIIDIPFGITSVLVRDLLSDIRAMESTSQGMAYGQIASASGNESLGDSVSVGITVNLLDSWQIRFAAGNYIAKVSGGNLVGGYAGDPIAYSAGVQVLLIQSAASTMVTTVTGSALTTAEHNQLMALPSPPTIWAHGIEAGYSAEELLRIALSALAGKVSGAAGTTISFRDLADSKDRITATVDSNGNRSGVTLNVS